MRFINALALLSGNVGRSGGGVYFHLHSYRNLDLGWIKGPGHKGRRAFHIATIGRDILAAQDPPVQMIWVNGANVVNQAPGALETARAFDRVAFKVVVDAFMNDTAERADLVLPCTLMLEQEDVVGSFLHEYVQYAGAVVEPPAEARSDLWIVTELGRRLDPAGVHAGGGRLPAGRLGVDPSRDHPRRAEDQTLRPLEAAPHRLRGA